MYSGETYLRSITIIYCISGLCAGADLDDILHRCNITQRGSQVISSRQVKISGGLPIVCNREQCAAGKYFLNDRLDLISTSNLE